MSAAAITIRPAAPTDAPAVSAILEAAYQRLVGLGPEALFAADQPRQWIAPALLASGHYFVALQDSKLIACGGWSHEVPGSGDIHDGMGHVRDFGTDPDHLRQGAARAVLSATIESARVAGLRELVCVSTSQAAPFYEAGGFTPERRDLVRLPNGQVTLTILMAMPLDGPGSV